MPTAIKPSNLQSLAFRLIVLSVGVLVALAALSSGVGDVVAMYSQQSAFSQSYGDEPVEWFVVDTLIHVGKMAWLAAKVLFWGVLLTIAAFVVLAAMAGAGIGMWCIQQVVAGFAYMVNAVKSAWAKTEATKPEGKMTVTEILIDLDRRVSEIEKAVKPVAVTVMAAGLSSSIRSGKESNEQHVQS